MVHSAFRIYLTANLLVYAFFAVILFPEGLGLGFIALLISALFSLPALFLLLFCFYLIHNYRPGIVASWTVLAVTVTVCVLLPVLFVGRQGGGSDYFSLFYLSAGAGLGGTLLQAFYIHQQFKNLHYEND